MIFSLYSRASSGARYRGEGLSCKCSVCIPSYRLLHSETWKVKLEGIGSLPNWTNINEKKTSEKQGESVRVVVKRGGGANGIVRASIRKYHIARVCKKALLCSHLAADLWRVRHGSELRISWHRVCYTRLMLPSYMSCSRVFLVLATRAHHFSVDFAWFNTPWCWWAMEGDCRCSFSSLPPVFRWIELRDA